MKSLCLMLGPDFITDILEVDFHDNWSFMQEAWSTMRDRSDDSLHNERTLYLGATYRSI